MKPIRKFFFYTLLVLSTGLILITLLSLIPNIRFWYYKLLDFPRLQYVLFALIFIFFLVLSTEKWKYPSWLLLSGLISVIIVHGVIIYPYLFGEQTVPQYLEESIKTEDTFSVLLANVLLDNRQSDAFLKIVKQKAPDILLAMEVDTWWTVKLQVLKEYYPYYIEHPLDNAYGMSLYSKLPM